MERLSGKTMEILNELHTERLAYESEYVPMADAINKLAAYEDTGLEPEEIEELLNKTYGPLHISIARALELAHAEKEGCVYCKYHKPLEPDGGGELQVVEIQPMPAVNLTTGKKDETEPPPYMALWFRAFDGEFEDFVPIRCCPMCGRVLKEGESRGEG